MSDKPISISDLVTHETLTERDYRYLARSKDYEVYEGEREWLLMYKVKHLELYQVTGIFPKGERMNDEA